MNYTVGVLALQGDFDLHYQVLQKLGQIPILVKTVQDLKKCDALIMPGGESTTVRRLSNQLGLTEELKRFGKNKPVMGTCAGLILLSKKIENSTEPTLGLIDITVKRNAYGRQVHSFAQPGKLVGLNGLSEFEMVFIRAPLITEVGRNVEKIGFLGEQVVMVQNQNILGLTFHPELTSDTRLHQYFLNKFLTKRQYRSN
jgi:5'-phosphate synthase pdxT subunit